MWFIFLKQNKYIVDYSNESKKLIKNIFKSKTDKFTKKFRNIENSYIVLKKNIDIFITILTKSEKIFNLYYKITFFKKCNFIILLNNYIKWNLNDVTKINNKKIQNNCIFLIKFKKQLLSSIMLNGKLKKFLTNGVFIKKLDLKKSQKKDDKIVLINLNDCILFIKKNFFKSNIVVNIKNTNNKFIKVINFIKKNFNTLKYLLIYTPKIPYSNFKYKKVKSIKRKLKKKYNYSVLS